MKNTQNWLNQLVKFVSTLANSTRTTRKSKATWIQWFLDLATVIAKKSKDPSTKVGALAVDHSNRILEVGYNGLPRGVRDEPSRMERPQKYLWTSHAEENLVAHAARDRLEGSTVYVTHLCCARCARSLINAGVARVICGDGKTNMDEIEFEIAKQMFDEAGVMLEFADCSKEND